MSTGYTSKSTILLIFTRLSLTNDVIVDLQHKCLPQPHLFALQMEGYIPGLIYGFTNGFTYSNFVYIVVVIVVHI